MRSPSAMGYVCLLLLIMVPSLAPAFGTGVIENRGQVNGPVLYYGKCPGAMVYFTEKAIVVELHQTVVGEEPEGVPPSPLDMPHESNPPLTRRGCAVYLYFDGACPPSSVEGAAETGTAHSYFIGPSPSEWLTGVREFSQVVYSGLWPGVDLIYRKEGARLTCEVVERVNGSSAQVGFACAGADSVIEEGNGALRIETELGTFWVGRPRAGERRDFLHVNRHAAPWAAGKEERRPDNPGALSWSTYLGNPADESVADISLDAAGNPVVTGWVTPPRFPGWAGTHEDSASTSRDLFVAKLSSSGNALLWCARLGGSGWDESAALALDPAGNALVTGFTRSTDFPTTSGAYDGTNEADDVSSAFLSKIAADGRSLLWSTFLHGSGHDHAADLCLDGGGSVIVTGTTGSVDFPATRGARCEPHAGATDVFVARFSPSGDELLWSRLIGGEDRDAGEAVALDGQGSLLLSGFTSSADFPTTPGAYQEQHAGGESDAFAAKLSLSGSSLFWSTFLGGPAGADRGMGVAVDRSGRVVVSGLTESADFPTTPGAHDRSFEGESDIFVAGLSPSGDALLWSTFLGGSGAEWWGDISVDGEGRMLAGGTTRSADFPIAGGSYDPDPNGGSDAFLAQLSPLGDQILWSTYLGGSENEEEVEGGRRSCAIGLDPSGIPVICGITRSSDFPTTAGALDETHSGGCDLFVAKLEAACAPTAVFGLQGLEAFAREDGIEVRWDVTSRHLCLGFYVLRSEGGGPFTTVTERMIPNEAPYYPKRFSWMDDSVEPGASYSYKVGLVHADGSSEVWERVLQAEAPSRAPFHLSVRGPQPVRLARSAEIAFSVPAPGAAVSITLYDIAGRRVATLAAGRAGAGTHVLPLSGPEVERLGSGIYFLRMDAGAFHDTKRVVLLH